MLAAEMQKKYRNKIIRYCVLAILFFLIISIIVIAFLGTRVGNYTVQLRPDNRAIAIDETAAFNNPTTRLRANALQDAAPISVSELPNDSILDSEVEGGNHSQNIDSTYDSSSYYIGSGGNFLAYTFFMKNVGDVNLNYALAINLEGLSVPVGSSNENGIDEIVRIRLYINEVDFSEDGTVETEHKSSTYAKVKKTQEVGDDDNREWIGREGDGYGRANPFYYGSQALIYLDNQPIYMNQIIRFTTVVWLEGDDPECNGSIPTGAAIKLGVILNALGEITGE